MTNHQPTNPATDETSQAERIRRLQHRCDMEAAHVAELKAQVRQLIAERDAALERLSFHAINGMLLKNLPGHGTIQPNFSAPPIHAGCDSPPIRCHVTIAEITNNAVRKNVLATAPRPRRTHLR